MSLHTIHSTPAILSETKNKMMYSFDLFVGVYYVEISSKSDLCFFVTIRTANKTNKNGKNHVLKNTMLVPQFFAKCVSVCKT